MSKEGIKKQTVIFDQIESAVKDVVSKSNILVPEIISYGSVGSLFNILRAIEKLITLKIDFSLADLGSINSNDKQVLQKKLIIEFTFLNQFTMDNLQAFIRNDLKDEYLIKSIDQSLNLRFRKVVIIKYEEMDLENNTFQLLVKKELDKYLPKINKSFEAYKQYFLNSLTFTVDID